MQGNSLSMDTHCSAQLQHSLLFPGLREGNNGISIQGSLSLLTSPLWKWILSPLSHPTSCSQGSLGFHWRWAGDGYQIQSKQPSQRYCIRWGSHRKNPTSILKTSRIHFKIERWNICRRPLLESLAIFTPILPRKKGVSKSSEPYLILQEITWIW